MVQPGSSRYKVIIRYDLNSRYFGVLDEMTAIRIFRTQQVFDTIINAIYGSVLIAYHHVELMLCFLGGSLTLLKATDKVLDGEPLMLAALLVAVFGSLLIEYEESTEISELRQKSDEFVRRRVSFRCSMLHKFAKSCGNLKVNSGYPFFNVGKDTFTQFLAHGFDFLIVRIWKYSALIPLLADRRWSLAMEFLRWRIGDGAWRWSSCGGGSDMELGGGVPAVADRRWSLAVEFLRWRIGYGAWRWSSCGGGSDMELGGGVSAVADRRWSLAVEFLRWRIGYGACRWSSCGGGSDMELVGGVPAVADPRWSLAVADRI
ncbi:unnamed protein product [Orchesella dallaii]|uniref:Uncharacterized protein n=1 Tax=Orchesella dallaii TaxID=48710 RepID=A0ABP1S1L5_9HEXA